jgi:preprotein translocase subunit YajC
LFNIYIYIFILIIICSAIAVISIILIIIFVISRKKRLSDKDIEEKTDQLAPMNP